MKCHRCKGDGRQNNEGRWEVCGICGGTGQATGADLKLMDAIISAGYSQGEAADIVARGTGMPEVIPVSLAPVAVAPLLTVGQKVRDKSNGQEMTVTALLGDDEVACEWPITANADGKTIEGREADLFNASSLEPVDG